MNSPRADEGKDRTVDKHALELWAEDAAVHQFVAIVVENEVGAFGHGEGGVSHYVLAAEHDFAPPELFGEVIVRDGEVTVVTGVRQFHVRLSDCLTIADKMAGGDLDAIAWKTDNAGSAFGFVGFHVDQIAAV